MKTRKYPLLLFRSDNGGKTWEQLNDRGPTELVQDPIAPEILYGLFRRTELRISRDRGRTWEIFAEGLPLDGTREAPEKVSRYRSRAIGAGPDFIVAGTNDGTIFRLECGTTVWKEIPLVSLEQGDWFGASKENEPFRHFGAATSSISIDPRDPEHWILTDWYAIHQSYDGGKSWVLTIDGIECTAIHCLEQDTAHPPLLHLGMADNGYFFSDDTGRSFTNVPFDSGGNNIRDIAFSPRLNTRIFAVGPDISGWYANQIFVSYDRGKHWQRSSMNGLPSMNTYRCNSLAVAPGNPDELYVCLSEKIEPGGGGPYRSIDGGESWEWIGAGMPRGGAFYGRSIWGGSSEIAVSGDGTVITISKEKKVVLRWVPGQERWIRLDPGHSGKTFFICADAFEPRTFYLSVVREGIYKTDDGGERWRQVFPRSASYIAVDKQVPGRVAAGTPLGPVVSFDGGESWVAADKRIPAPYHTKMAFAGDNLLAATNGNGVFWMPIDSLDSTGKDSKESKE
jgi:hypothetical protein